MALSKRSFESVKSITKHDHSLLRRLLALFPDPLSRFSVDLSAPELDFDAIQRLLMDDALPDPLNKLLYLSTALGSPSGWQTIEEQAAREGLNLQTLGTLINIDLPWNPSRLEQRLGRIKRFGQARSTVDMLNLVYNDTRDQTIYHVLSQRMKNVYDIFGSLPDTIEDDWIDDEERLQDKMDTYIHKREEAENAFTVRYRNTVDPEANRWEFCSEVLSRADIVEKMQQGWR